VGLLLDARDAGLAVHAISIANWHATHPRCPRCGAPTRTASAGHSRMCDVDGSEHYPRTDPAVIMAVVDGDDRLLLGRQSAWPEGRFSTLAGFVEPGESLEQAVRREVAEEVGLEIGDVAYLGSQPWPFPASLMLGFVAHARTTEVHRHDGEIAEARWFTRDNLIDAVRRGEVLLSPPVSIARRLIEHWYGTPIDDAQEAWR
jgi:NAD+ diphosphatase